MEKIVSVNLKLSSDGKVDVDGLCWSSALIEGEATYDTYVSDMFLDVGKNAKGANHKVGMKTNSRIVQ